MKRANETGPRAWIALRSRRRSAGCPAEASATAEVSGGRRRGRGGQLGRTPHAPLDLTANLEDPFDQGLGAGRAAADVDVDPDDLVDALDDGVRNGHASRRRTGPHRGEPAVG